MRHSLSKNPAIRDKARRLAIDPDQLRVAVTSLMSPRSEPQTEDVLAWIKVLSECQTFLFAVYVMSAREQAVTDAGGGLPGLAEACKTNVITEAMDLAQGEVNMAVNDGKINAVAWINRWALGEAR